MCGRPPNASGGRIGRRAAALALALALAACSPRASLAERSALESGVGSTAIVNANLVPMNGDGVLVGWTLVLRDGRIEDLGPSSSFKVPRGAAVMDGAGLWLTPGLYDCAAEVSQSDLARLLAAGVTTVRTTGGAGAASLLLRDAVASGRELGPRLFVTGPSLAGASRRGGPAAALSPLEARREVEAQKRAGYDAIAVGAGIEPLSYATATRAAQELRLPVAGNLPSRLPRAESLVSGQRSKEGLVSELDPATGEPLASAAALDAAARADAASGIWTIPTLAAHRMRGSRETLEALLARPGMRSVPPRRRARWKLEREAAPPDYAYRGAAEIARRLHAAGARVLLGSGAGATFVVAGSSIHDEIANLVAAGFTPYEAIRAGTRDAAEYLGEQATSGTIEPGKRADLIVLRANPLADPRALADPAGIFLAGRWLPGSQLRAAVDSVAASFEAPRKRFAEFEPLTVSDGYRYARYEITLSGTAVGEERVRIGPAAEGGRELRAQSSVDPDDATLVELRVVLSEDGRAQALRVTRDVGAARDRVEIARSGGAAGRAETWNAARLHASGERAGLGRFTLDVDCADGAVLAGPALAPGLDAEAVSALQLVMERVDGLAHGASMVFPVTRVMLDDAPSGGDRVLLETACLVTRLDDATIQTSEGPRTGRRFRVEESAQGDLSRLSREVTLGPDGLVHSVVGDGGAWSAARVR